MGKIAFIFPGQGSQKVGMGLELAERYESSKQIFESADKRLQFPLTDVIFSGPAAKLKKTENTQPALLTTSIAILAALKEHGITADYVAGHSLGEYSALVAAEAISFEDAVYTVRKRGLYMEEAVPSGEGAMAAILGMDRGALEQVTKEVTANGDLVQLANLNCPGQIAISGTASGVSKATQLAKDNGARRAIPLEVSGPFHSELMKPAADRLKAVLDEITIENAKVPVIANVTAAEMTMADDIKEKLIKQIYSPVLWEDTVKKLLELDVETFVEIGPGTVLSGLVRKVDRNVKTYAVSDKDSLMKLVSECKRGNE